MNPKQALETDSIASCEVLNPPLRGIVQLTNSAAPIVTFRSFAFGIGVSTIKVKFLYVNEILGNSEKNISSLAEVMKLKA